VRATDPRVLGLQHLDVEREVVADDDVRTGEGLGDLVGDVGERWAALEIRERDAVNRLRPGMDADGGTDPPHAVGRAVLEAVLDAQLDDLVVGPVRAGGLAIEHDDRLPRRAHRIAGRQTGRGEVPVVLRERAVHEPKPTGAL
jgi:hypothetical protein